MIKLLSKLQSPKMDKASGKKLAKSAGLGGVGVVAINVALSQGWIPEDMQDPQSIAALTGVVTWGINLVRKLLIRNA